MSLIFRQIRLHAAASPARPAIMLPDRVASFSMVSSGIESARGVLDGFRLDREKPVGVLIENPIRHLLLALALIKSGYAVAPLRRDLLKPARDAGVTTILTDERSPLGEGLRCVSVDERWFNDPRPKPVAAPDIAPDRVVRIAFTSGSTGRPKPVAQTHRSCVETMQIMTHVGHGYGQRVMSAYGLSGDGFLQAIMTIMGGRTVCFAPANEMLQMMLFGGADALRGSVGQVSALLSAQEELGRPLRLTRVSIGGALLSADLADRIGVAFGCGISNNYASTEGSQIGYASGALLASRRTRGNRYAPVCEVRICEPSGQEVDPGSEGLVHVRSSRTARLFSGALDLDAKDLASQWVATGDLGYIDDEGFLVVTGRADEVINLGGAKFDPEVIESILLQHPAIRSAAVLRMIGADGGHEAWVFVPHGSGLDADSLNDWFSKRVSGEMLAVRFARVETIDSLPMTPSGKIDRGSLRSRFSGRA